VTDIAAGSVPRRMRVSIPYPVMLGLLLVAAAALYLGSELLGTQNQAETDFGQLIGAIGLVIIVCRIMGEIVSRLGQPRVMGELLGGILLGPSLIGALPQIFPALCGSAGCPPNWPFSATTLGGLRAAAEVGLVFYMFLVGLELDPTVLRARAKQALAISLTSVALPFSIGTVAAIVLLGQGSLYGDATRPAAFIVFMGVSMSITAFPVLARILVERRMVRGPIGALALACAAVDDVVAWSLLALATVFAAAGAVATAAPGAAPGAAKAPAPDPIAIVLLAVAFCLLMAFLARPILARVAEAYEESGHVPAGWVVVVFVGILAAAFLSQRVGIATIFGAFVVGLIMPRHGGLTTDISNRLEDFAVIVLLPLFFVVSGMRTNIAGHLGDPSFWVLTAVLTAIAIGGKWIGASVAARATGLDRQGSIAIGALMNTRGLTELIVLNVGLTLGVISQDLFTALVLMALITTFMTGPALRLIDRHGFLSVLPEVEVEQARPSAAPPARALLVATQDDRNEAELIRLAKALASGPEPREAILVRLIQPSRLTTRYSPAQRAATAAAVELRGQADALIAGGVPARSVVLMSARLDQDLVRLANDPRVDLILADGRRSLAREEVPGGAVGALLEQAASDVAILVRKAVGVHIDMDHPVVVPFGGSDHDWAALEIGARIADAYGSRLRLVGAREDDGARDAGGLLASAALAVQGVSGIAVEPVIVTDPKEVLVGSADAGLLVVGLSRRWRQEGLGTMRRSLAIEGQAPILFVRRGTRGGLLAPAQAMTQLGWSLVGTPKPPVSAG
jgi:Kef-type K+ transport system membrane component KefB